MPKKCEEAGNKLRLGKNRCGRNARLLHLKPQLQLMNH